MEAQNDLRYIKVEEAIRQAFLKLLAQKPVDQISVSEICQEARCSRNAFYGHHASRDQLCADMLNEFEQTLRKACADEIAHLKTGVSKTEALASALIEAIHAHETFLRVLFQSDNGVFAFSLFGVVERSYLNALEDILKASDARAFELHIAYTAAGAVGFAQRWLLGENDFDRAREAFISMQVPISDSIEGDVLRILEAKPK